MLPESPRRSAVVPEVDAPGVHSPGQGSHGGEEQDLGEEALAVGHVDDRIVSEGVDLNIMPG